MTKSAPPTLRKFPAAKQRRLDELLEKNSEGTITSREDVRLKQLVAEAEQLMVANAKLLEDSGWQQGPLAGMAQGQVLRGSI